MVYTSTALLVVFALFLINLTVFGFCPIIITHTIWYAMCSRSWHIASPLWYDMIYLHALRGWRDGQLNLAHGTETKKWGKNKTKPSSSEETVQVVVSVGSAGGRSGTTGVGFVKQVGFKPGVKERGSYRWAEWWIRRGRSDQWSNRWVWNGGTGTRMRLMKR